MNLAVLETKGVTDIFTNVPEIRSVPMQNGKIQVNMTYKKPVVIAEIGCNHKGYMEITGEMIKTAICM